MWCLVGAILVTFVRAQEIPVSTPGPKSEVVTYGDTYIVGVPQCIRPGLSTDVYVDIVRRVGPCTVLVELYNRTTGIVYASSQDIVHPGNPQQITLQIPKDIPIPQWYYRDYYIRVSGNAESVSFKNETSVRLNNQNVTGFVQTDKAIYKPGQTVHYRVFFLLPDLKINKAPYNIEIRDGKGNKIRDEKDVSDPTGLVRGSLLLSEEPVFGQWRITVYSAAAQVSKSFEVREYVLPRIEVTVTPPSFIYLNQSTVDVDIGAKYTFGEDARGTLLVTAKIVPWWSRNKGDVQPTLKKTIPNFVGSGRVSFLMEDVLTLHQYARYYTLNVEANLTETLTGVVASGTGQARIYEVAEKVEYLPTNPNTFKPTLSYTAYVKLSQQDGTAIVGTPDSLKVRVQYSYPIRVPQITSTRSVIRVTKPPPASNSSDLEPSPIMVDEDWWYPRYERKNLTTLELTVPADGIVEIDIPSIPDKAESITLISTYKGKDYWFSADRAYSPSNSFIQLAVVKELRQPGERQKLRLKSNVPIDSFSLLITSRGRVVMTREETRVNKATELGISFTITRSMAPRARVVAYYRTPDGEIVPDVVTFNVLDPFENKVSIGFSAEEVRPGEDVTMTVLTAPNSLVATLVLDKEVLLLKSGNDITQEQVTNSLWKYESCGYYGWWWRGGIIARRRRKRSFIPWRYPYFGSGRDANAVFSEAGLTILTDSLLYSHTYSNNRWVLEKTAAPELAFGGTDNLQPVETIRKNFPETWLFDVEVSNENGVVNIDTIAPDSITSWQATAFAFNDLSGFGISTQPAKLTVVKPFFANLFMPYSVIRGEELFLQVNVFNYMSVNQTVVVELQGSTSYSSLDIDDSGNEILVSGARTQTLTVPSGIPKSVVFPIRTLELGDIPITVTARSSIASDGLTKTLRVIPEGVPSEYNFVELVNLTASSQYQVTRTLSYPPGLVDGSQRLGVKLVGDVLGSTVANLAGLVRMSYGCGEQNMVNFAPTVAVAKYLESVGQLTGEKKEDAINYISSGYQRQLNYKRQDGSYSAFGDRDASGSLWLTAFVAKSFVTASQEGFLTVDEKALTAAFNYIIKRQNKDGSFNNTGKLHNRRLQGQSGRGNALTAYVLSALLESNIDDASLNTAKSKAQSFVENYVLTSTDLYELAIAAYALELAKSPQAASVLANLESRATKKDGYTYWEVEAEPVYRWEPPRHQTKAASIEATSYVCLVYALKKDISKSSQCLAWLVSQQNDYGGYVSTQDTVVAVQALSAIAPFFYSSTQSGSITVEADGSSVSFTVNDANRLDLQQATLPVSANSVTVRGSGSGVFLVSISAKYNIDDGLVQPAFSLTATLTRDTPTAMDLTVCARYLRGKASSMANIEIRLPSDFTLTGESKDELLTTAKRVDFLDGKVLLYLDEITDRSLCVSLTATGNGNINKPKPCPVRVFDYYSPDDSALAFYRLTSLDGDFCDVAACTSDPAGCSTHCSKRRRK
ncbi:CD109 antigen-like [Liolophura sinensis]|uniref:CD109 antigen-like n=1 Tax=Liolophura sinensis TaxID=3198878 RepID=UPI003158BF7F